MRALELFAGIGGFAAASPFVEIVAAVDIDRQAGQVYRANFSHTYHHFEIASLPSKWFASLDADLWWMSPPCLPFTIRGKQLDQRDPRARSLLHLIEVVRELRPEHVLIENVPGFESSQVARHLQNRWQEVGYTLQTQVLCPSQWGWPNRRRRVYLYATSSPNPMNFPIAVPVSVDLPYHKATSLASMIELGPVPSHFFLSEAEIAKHGPGLDRIEIDQPTSHVTACFGASYGRSMRGAGSYLVSNEGWRRFIPREVARFLGFPETFILPDSLSDRQLWRLLGNSISVPVVRSLVDGLS